jgi:hypothetical protein
LTVELWMRKSGKEFIDYFCLWAAIASVAQTFRYDAGISNPEFDDDHC